jgi:hypothetical protein
VIAAAGGSCTAGIALLVATGAALFAVTIWPAFVLGLLPLSQGTADRVERGVARAALALLVVAVAGVVAVLALRC